MTVERARVGDVLRLVRRPVVVDPMSTYELVGAYSFGKGLFRREAKSGSELGDFKFFALQPGDLVLSNIQAWEGAIALAGPEHAGLIGTHRFLSYVPRDDRIDAAWARWFFLSEPGMELIRRAAPGTAVRNRTLSMERFEALEIPLPSLQQQRATASKLAQLQAAINTGLGPRGRRSDATLMALGSAALHQEVSTLRSRSRRLATLEELGAWSSGGTPSAKEPSYYGGDIAWAVIGDLNDGLVRETERTLSLSGLEQSSAKIVPAGSLMVAMYGSIGKLGVAAVEMSTNQAIACCQPAMELTSTEYLFSFLRCIRSDLVQLGQGGAQQNISQSLLKSVSVPLPDRDEQQTFVEKVELHLQRLARAKRMLDRRRELIASLVPSALNGAFRSLS